MRVLSIDYGKKRTGLAVTDPAQIIANALTTVDTSELMAFVMHYVATEPVERIVIGLPVQTHGLPSENQQRARRFGDKLQERLKSGKIKDFGTSTAIAIEKIIDFSPDAVVISAMEDNNSYAKLLKVGIPVVECADYMETGPLQRAEWMRFYGRLVGKGKEADSIFDAVEKEYKSLKEKVKKVKSRPTVLDGKKLDSSWYVPGINSTVGQMIEDAGGKYVFEDEKSNGAVPYSPEVVLDRGADADIWMLKHYSVNEPTYSDLAAEWQGYAKLKAFKNHNAYVVNLQKSDFYMNTPYHPEILLHEYVNIFHPELGGKYTDNKYFHRVEK